MIDLRVPCRAVRGVLSAVVLAGLMAGCSGESTPPPSDAAASTPPPAAGDAKKPVAKQPGGGAKGNLMPEFPKG